MICPNCGSEMSEKKKRCDRCGQDLTLYKKILNTADLYYNIGLRKARVRDLSGAILCLKKSLELNKRHMYARNLLGLIYYEVGETVSALSEWVISKHFNPDNNDADEYMDLIQASPTKLDTLNQTIKKYNSALLSAKQGSTDLAIIQLKKVITLNPHFVKSLQLLALLYIQSGEYDKAKKCLLKANKIDIANETTLQYLRVIDEKTQSGKEESSEAGEGSKAEESVYHPHLAYKEDKPNIMLFINLIIGVLIGVAITYILVIPTVKKKYYNIQNESHVNYGEAKSQQESLEKTIIQLQQDNADLEKEVKDLRSQVAAIDQMEEVIPEDYSGLFEVVNLYIDELGRKEKDRELVPIAAKLAEIDTTGFTSEKALALYDELKDTVGKKASKEVYDKGHDLYGDGKYENALVYLNEALLYDEENIDAMYFIGRCYHKLGNKEQAVLYYDILLNDYPDSTRAEQAGQFVDDVR